MIYYNVAIGPLCLSVSLGDEHDEANRKEKAMFATGVLGAASKLTLMAGSLGNSAFRTAQIERPEKQTQSPTKCLIAAVMLIGAASTASAHYLPYNGLF